MVGVMLATLVTAMAVTLDIARAYYAQRELQKLANMAAIDAARAIGGCQGDFTAGAAQTAADLAVADSLAANAQAGVLGIAPVASAVVGTVDTTGTFRFVNPDTVDGPEDPRFIAAQVNLTSRTPSRLINALSEGTTLRASSAATNSPMVTMVVRSRLLRLNPSNSSLPAVQQLSTALFGDSDFIELLNSESIADVDVTLLDIVGGDVEVGGDGLIEVNDLNAPGLDGLLDGIRDTVNGVNPAAANVVDQVRDVLDGLGLLDAGNMDPADIFDLPPDQEAIAGLIPLNVSDLLNSISTGVLGDAPIDIPIVGGLPAGLADVNLSLQILEPPTIKVGRVGLVANAAQVRLSLGATLDIGLPGLLGLPGLDLLDGDINLNLASASGEGTLDAIDCADSANDGIHEVQITADSDAVLMDVSTDLELLGLPLLGLDTGGIEVSSGGGEGDLVFSGPQRADVSPPYIGDFVEWPEETGVSSGIADALADLSNDLQLEVAGADIGVGTVGLPVALTALSTIFDFLDDVISPLADVLGLSVATADYSVREIAVNAEGRPTVDMLIH